MKRHLNTLFVTTEGSYLAKDGQAVAVHIDNEVKLRIPLHNLDGIVCLGRVGFSSALAGACAESNVTLSLMTPSGKFLASVVGYSPGNVLLRRQQYRSADESEATLRIAKNIVLGKIANCRSVLFRGARDHRDEDAAERLRGQAKKMAGTLNLIRDCQSPDSVRGYEGDLRLNTLVFSVILYPFQALSFPVARAVRLSMP